MAAAVPVSSISLRWENKELLRRVILDCAPHAIADILAYDTTTTTTTTTTATAKNTAIANASDDAAAAATTTAPAPPVTQLFVPRISAAALAPGDVTAGALPAGRHAWLRHFAQDANMGDACERLITVFPSLAL